MVAFPCYDYFDGREIIQVFFDVDGNVVEQPLIYFDNEGMYPLSVTLTDVGSSDYGIIFACGVIFMIPALLIYLYGHRDIDSPFVGTDKG